MPTTPTIATPGTLTLGNVAAVPNANTTVAEQSSALNAGWSMTPSGLSNGSTTIPSNSNGIQSSSSYSLDQGTTGALNSATNGVNNPPNNGAVQFGTPNSGTGFTPNGSNVSQTTTLNGYSNSGTNFTSTNGVLPSGGSNTGDSAVDALINYAMGYKTTANSDYMNLSSAISAQTSALQSTIANQSAQTQALYGNQLQQLQVQQTNSIGQFVSAASAMNPYAHNSPVVAAGVAAIGQKYALLAQNITENAALAETTAQGQEAQVGAQANTSLAQALDSMHKDVSSVMSSALEAVRAQSNFDSSLANQNQADLRSMLTTGQTGLSSDFTEQLGKDLQTGNVSQSELGTLLSSTGGIMAIKNGVIRFNPDGTPDMNSVQNYANSVVSGYANQKMQLQAASSGLSIANAELTLGVKQQQVSAQNNLNSYLDTRGDQPDFTSDPSGAADWVGGYIQNSSGIQGLAPLNPTVSKQISTDFENLTNVRSLGLQMSTLSDQDTTSLGGAVNSMLNNLSKNGTITLGAGNSIDGVQYSAEVAPIAIGIAKALNGGRPNQQEIQGLQGSLGGNLTNPTWMRQNLIGQAYRMVANNTLTDLSGAASSGNDVSRFSYNVGDIKSGFTQFGITGGGATSGAAGSTAPSSSSGSQSTNPLGI